MIHFDFLISFIYIIIIPQMEQFVKGLLEKIYKNKYGKTNGYY